MFTPQKAIRRYPSRDRTGRRGVATVELAICLPIMVALTVGTMDLCSMLFIKESVTLAAYEGARQGVGRGFTNATARARVLEFLDERNIQYSSADVVQIDAPGFDNAETLDNVRLTVTVPLAGNLNVPSKWFGDMSVNATVTMRKEYKNLDEDN
ncbi:TadE-like protein [Novipirellula aureliae]|uniref:TadE-like protein n=1 Tax=Novipirellula aureliae TaxID=2527966 RepID=A0A5C6DUH1_9BACT|nr:TadE/TadG family type IV pilus assembly protein [Novipirellula aureliae]TWU39071.1 TadE-like protein [Novipirellula aureliae]